MANCGFYGRSGCCTNTSIWRVTPVQVTPAFCVNCKANTTKSKSGPTAPAPVAAAPIPGGDELAKSTGTGCRRGRAERAFRLDQ
jgi:hypothetical protein